jgi:HK97 family phage major capsid protein
MNERELLVKRATLVTRAREMIELCEKESREFSAEEQTNYDALFADMGKLDQKIENIRKLGSADDPGFRTSDALRPEGGDGRGNPDEEKRATAWSGFLRTGAIQPEVRALQADSDVAGGYYTAPQQFVNRLIKAIDDEVWVRQWATKNPVTSSQSLGVPTLAADPADADWTSELAIGGTDSTMAFGKRELNPKPLAKLLKVSRKLLRLSPDVDSLVINRLGYKAAMTGSGANQPLGVFTASAEGISTGRDVSTGNTATSLQTDGLIEAKYTLKAGYWPRARWVFHRDAVKQLAKLQDDDGHYLWQNSIQLGQPDMLMGVPLFVSEYAPSTFTTGLYVGIIGDFSYFWTADALDFSVQRLEELYAATNQTGFIGRLESDGMPVLEEAFVRVKLA